MAIQIGDRAELAADDASKLEVRHLKTKIHSLITERDRAVTRAEQAQQMLELERAARRHSMSVTCDGDAGGDPCRERLAVTCSTAPAEGAHAAALFNAGRTMGWTLSAATTGALHQLMGRPCPAATSGRDLCARCTAVENTADPR